MKAVPDSFSAYRPYGAFWGEFWPTGRAPSMASVLRELIPPSQIPQSKIHTHDKNQIQFDRSKGLGVRIW